MTKYVRAGASAFALVIAVVAVTWLSGQDALGQGAFAPCGSAVPVDTTPGAASNITGTFGIGIGADCLANTADDTKAEYNSGGLVTFTPAEWVVALDADIEDGAQVGTFNSLAVLGLLNNPCTNQLPVPFNLFDGTTDTSKSIDALPSGTSNRMKNLIADGNGNGIPDGVDQWPSYLSDLAVDNDWDLGNLLARYVGFAEPSGTGTTVVLNFLLFEPGSFINELFNVDPRLGYPSVTVLQDPTAAASPDDPITDFCAPLAVTNSIFGEVDGTTFRGNPSEPGTYYFTTFAVAQADADGDGIENGLDPCPLEVDADYDPRIIPAAHAGDTDGDGLPNGCDPFPEEKSKCTAAGLALTDEDCDGWMNRVDNCPIVANADQDDEDSDQIGDACDPTPNDRSDANNFLSRCVVTAVTIGSGGPVGQDPSIYQPCGTEPLPTPQPGVSPTPVPTDAAGNTPTPGPAATGTGGVGPPAGIGSLAPTGNNVPLWAVLLAALSLVGVAGGLSLTARRRQ